jgi:hypothetical protein
VKIVSSPRVKGRRGLSGRAGLLPGSWLRA